MCYYGNHPNRKPVVQDCGKLASAFCAIHLDKEVLELTIEIWGGRNLPIDDGNCTGNTNILRGKLPTVICAINIPETILVTLEISSFFNNFNTRIYSPFRTSIARFLSRTCQNYLWRFYVGYLGTLIPELKYHACQKRYPDIVPGFLALNTNLKIRDHWTRHYIYTMHGRVVWPNHWTCHESLLLSFRTTGKYLMHVCGKHWVLVRLVTTIENR